MLHHTLQAALPQPRAASVPKMSEVDMLLCRSSGSAVHPISVRESCRYITFLFTYAPRCACERRFIFTMHIYCNELCWLDRLFYFGDPTSPYPKALNYALSPFVLSISTSTRLCDLVRSHQLLPFFVVHRGGHNHPVPNRWELWPCVCRLGRTIDAYRRRHTYARLLKDVCQDL